MSGNAFGSLATEASEIGLSVKRRRYQIDSTTSRMLNRNAILQPHSTKAGPVSAPSTMSSSLLSNNPAGSPIMGAAPYSALQFAGACSTAIVTAPPHSAPRSEEHTSELQ